MHRHLVESDLDGNEHRQLSAQSKRWRGKKRKRKKENDMGKESGREKGGKKRSIFVRVGQPL